MKQQVGETSSWQNSKMAKQQVDKTASWQNVMLIKQQLAGEMVSCWNSKLTILRVDKNSKLSNGKLMKQQVYKTVSWQNGTKPKCQVEKIAKLVKRQVGKRVR